MSKQTIQDILKDLREFGIYEETWKEAEKKLLIRERQVAKDYNDYCNDVRQELMKKPMTFDEWYEAYNK